MAAIVRLMGWMLLISLLFWAIAILASYALFVAIVGGFLALMEVRARRAGRPFVEPAQRFLSVWTRAISPIDRKNWITPTRRPATDPALLPGSLTGRLRVEHVGTERCAGDSTHDAIVVRVRLHNHGDRTIELADLDDVDFQLWTPEGTVLGNDATWSEAGLVPGQSRELTVTAPVVSGQLVTQWAISHRAENAPYAFFDIARLPQETA